MTDRNRWTGPDDSAPAPRMPAAFPRRTGRDVPADGRALTGPGVLPQQRDHEVARLRAKLMNPETAYQELIERLNYAVLHAGKPSLTALGRQVDYSKATLSKVLAGKAMPSWVLVRRLGEHLQVPPAVLQEWDTLWIAAGMHGRKTATAAVPAVTPDTGTAEVKEETGYMCRKCGSWVVDTALHTDWHLDIEAPRAESISGWTI